MFKNCFCTLSISLLITWAAIPATAADWFVAANSPQTGNGSTANPFPTLNAAFASGAVSSGDRVILSQGDYGHVEIAGVHFQSTVDVVPAANAKVHFDGLTVINSTNIRFSDLQVWPGDPKPSDAPLVDTAGNAVSIEFDNLDIRSIEQAHEYRRWSADMWHAVRRRGVLLRGDRNIIRNSHVTGLYIAIIATGDRALVSGNKISGFSGDALRSLGDFSLVANNYVEDCFQIDGNHADGFQSWSRGPNGKSGTGTVRGLTVENNIFVEWVGNTRHPLRCSLQGIGLFDGMFESLTIQNNVVAASAYHGISVAGAINSSIVNNTVVNADGAHSDRPWIAVSSHKRGMPSRQVTVANNIAMRFRIPENLRVANDGNQTINSPARELAAPFSMDFRPPAGSRFIGAANDRYAPQTDILGTPRPQNGQSDVGAFELR